jgi:predicted exporter
VKLITSNVKVLSILWLLFVTAIAVIAFNTKPVFDSSIMSLLPKSKQQVIVQQATEQMSDVFAKRVIFLLSSNSDSKVREIVSTLAGRLELLPDVVNVEWQVNESDFSKSQQELYPYRFALIDPVSRQLMLNQQFKDIQTRALLNLYSPITTGAISIIDDPFGLFTQLKLNRKTELNLQVSNSLLKVVGSQQPTYMLIMTLAEKPFSPELQQRVLSVIDNQKLAMKKLGVNMAMSGMLLHAAAGAEQANKEIMSIGLGSLLGIIIMMLFVFRQFKPLLMMIFSVLIGCVVAIAVTTLIFERIHVITLAFGAGLIGVSLDYALHYLCERRVTHSDKLLPKILMGLLLGLFSSVIAYAAQAMAPFPGLQQMAVFSVIGLIASWLTVVLCFPLLTQSDPIRPLKAAAQLTRLLKNIPRVENCQKTFIAMLLISVFIAALTLSKSQNVDDVRLLQTSPVELLQQENFVKTQLNASSNSQFLLIQANSVEAGLQKEEALRPLLERLISTTSITGYQALSTVLPSLNKQEENARLIKELYRQQLSSFYEQLDMTIENYQKAQASLTQALPQRLSFDEWQQHEESRMWENFIVSAKEGQFGTIIRFSGVIEQHAKQQLAALVAGDDQIIFVDQIRDISNIMGEYRKQIINLVLIAYLFVLLVLLHRYRTQVWRIILPPLLASIFTLAILTHLEQGINVFHLMALILVLGIGLDMGVFLTETRESLHTWLAVSLSAYTSLLAFGLLTLSDTPVLHHFGLTVLVGLTLVWMLVLVMRKNISEYATKS